MTKCNQLVSDCNRLDLFMLVPKWDQQALAIHNPGVDVHEVLGRADTLDGVAGGPIGWTGMLPKGLALA